MDTFSAHKIAASASEYALLDIIFRPKFISMNGSSSLMVPFCVHPFWRVLVPHFLSFKWSLFEQKRTMQGAKFAVPTHIAVVSSFMLSWLLLICMGLKTPDQNRSESWLLIEKNSILLLVISRSFKNVRIWAASSPARSASDEYHHHVFVRLSSFHLRNYLNILNSFPVCVSLSTSFYSPLLLWLRASDFDRCANILLLLLSSLPPLLLSSSIYLLYFPAAATENRIDNRLCHSKDAETTHLSALCQHLSCSLSYANRRDKYGICVCLVFFSVNFHAFQSR